MRVFASLSSPLYLIYVSLLISLSVFLLLSLSLTLSLSLSISLSRSLSIWAHILYTTVLDILYCTVLYCAARCLGASEAENEQSQRRTAICIRRTGTGSDQRLRQEEVPARHRVVQGALALGVPSLQSPRAGLATVRQPLPRRRGSEDTEPPLILQ